MSRRERAMVPSAEVRSAPDFESYYGRPILKQPTWKSPEIPTYFFSGGLAGASALLAEFAAATGRPGLARAARFGASAGALAGVGLLIKDLGRPSRFLTMMRVVKVTSPLSVGTWILSPFSGLATAAVASEVTGVLPVLGRAAGIGAAAFGGPMTTYTAALIADTAIPAWHDAHRELPVVFAGSSAAAAGGLGLLGAPVAENRPAARLGALGAAVELAASTVMERRLGGAGEKYKTGKAGRLMRAARLLSAAGIAGALTCRRSRTLAAVSGLALLAGSAATRFGIFEAGRASAADPRDVIVPQRARRAARDDGARDNGARDATDAPG
ncbi:polysulfide reductase NrfD [Planosporangium thailandense]|uniref:Polysulfide reductase NrfD n=1 Tax=Planosporangium thailandense TaxID=765197 RepID=A0ABX0Y4F5_9ACTN|nr:NrfD/PsrC family molybdoenzyme membrane anchor subunit [Planosporangium thailandense]NJC72290.1 polysulfide reductase NrfD [Planosporangium thailandense]